VDKDNIIIHKGVCECGGRRGKNHSIVTLAFDRKIHVTRTGIIVGTCVNIQSSTVSPLAPVNTDAP